MFGLGEKKLTHCIRHRDGSMIARITQDTRQLILEDAKFHVTTGDNCSRYVIDEPITFGVDGLKIFVWEGYYITFFKG